MLAVLPICVSSATAKSSRGVVFPQGSLTFGWKSLSGNAGRKVLICNGGRTAAKLDLRLTGFKFGYTPPQSNVVARYAPRRVLKLTGPEIVKAGRCAYLTVTLADPALIVDPASYSGEIVVGAVGLGVGRQKLTIVGPGAVPKPAVVAGAMEQQTLEAENSFPGGDLDLESSELLLKPPASGTEEPTIGAGCKELSNGKWSKQCVFIGNLYKGDDVIEVFLAGPVATDEHISRLPIRVEGSGSVGDYEGTLDPAGGGEEEEAVKAKLTLTDSVWWAIGAIILGAAIGVLIKLWTERWRLKFQLKQRMRKLVPGYEAAVAEANAWLTTEDLARLHVQLKPGGISGYAQEVQDAIFSYSWSTLLLKTDSDGYKQVEGSLLKAEEDQQLLAAGLGKALSTLGKAGSEVEDWLVRNDLVVTLPELLTRARALLKEREYSVGDATARSKKAGELSAMLETWLGLAKRVIGDEAWLLALATKVKTGTKKRVPKADRDALDELETQVRAIHEELFRAIGDQDLERLRISGRIEKAHSQISYLGGKLEVQKPAEGPATLLAKEAVSAVDNRFEDAFSSGDLSSKSGSVSSNRATAVKLPEHKFFIVLGDTLVLLMAIVVAIVGGLAAFYFGNTWGTTEDYLTVILAGTGAQLLITAILDHFSAFLHDLAPLAKAAPAEIKVKPASAS